jgi:replication factor C small subunit
MSLEIWAEKYRPKTLAEMINQKHVTDRMRAFVKDRHIPHLMFAGPAGTGKTTMALALSRELYGADWRKNVLELNASVTPDTPIMIRQRGVVRRINFAQLDKEFFPGAGMKYAYPKNLEILSVDKNTKKVCFKPVANISRHRVDKIVEIKFEGGSVKTTLNHSVIILGEDGSFVDIPAAAIRAGDTILSFSQPVEGLRGDTGVGELGGKEYCKPVHGKTLRNHKYRKPLQKIKFDNDISWLLGSYLAEGAVSVNQGASVLTYGYPKEFTVAEQASRVSGKAFGIPGGMHTTISTMPGRESAIQLTFSSIQPASFFDKHFYESGGQRYAWTERVPDFVYSMPLEMRHKFLIGCTNDATGEWNNYARYSSRSRNRLIDVCWLGRISGLETSFTGSESRIVCKRPAFTYARSELMPADVVSNFFEKIGDRAGFNWRYEMRHQLYSKRSGRVSKKLVLEMLEKLDRSKLGEMENRTLENLKALASSGLYALKVKEIKVRPYRGFVYDVSVPGSEMFWGGTAPVLLHNSDERGIDVIRHKVKEFARTKPMGGVPFRMIILDEADALTQDAQQALRRTMESYTSVSRFVLICNWSTKIIEPIQSRCAVFRFRSLSEEDIRKYIDRVAISENLKVDESAVAAIIDITEGDLRRVSNLMQSAASLGKEINEGSVYDAASRARPNDVRDMFKLAMNGEFMEARKALQNILLKQGLAGSDILSEIHRQIYNFDIPEEKKIALIDKCGEYDFRISEGGNELIQLEAFLAQVALLAKK